MKCLLFFLFTPLFFVGQPIPDSLKTKSFEYLFEKSIKSKDTLTQRMYANASIFKAKKSNSIMALCNAYSVMAYTYKDEQQLVYADSIIALTKNNSTKKYPAYAYITKADYYYRKRDFKRALNFSIVSLEYSKRHNDTYSYIDNNHLIALLKIRMGENEEALQITRNNLSIIKSNSNYNYAYLPTLFSIADIHTDLKQLDSAYYYNNLGFKKALKTNSREYENYFRLNQGVVHFFLEDYYAATDSINIALKDTLDKPNLAVAHYYLAKSYKELDNEELMISNLKQVDSIFLEINDVLPELKESYSMLIDYYKNNSDYKNQLIYVNRLIKLDSILHKNEVYLNKILLKNYDIPKLLTQRDAIIKNIKQEDLRKRYFIYILLSSMAIIVYALYYQSKKRATYKRRFNDIINNHENTISKKETNSIKNKKTELEINDAIVKDILSSLESFEEDNGYLKENITTHSLAQEFNTNPKYLSKIIKHYKNCSFTNYINSLRVNFAVKELQNNPNFKKFTLKAIANEVGFKKTETLTKAFLKHKGVTPAFFVKELNK